MGNALNKVTLTPARRQVYARWQPDRIGVILSEGQEVSEVRWEDKSTDYIRNEQLVTAKSSQTEGVMSVNQVQEYNNLVATANALGLSATIVKRFKNSAAGDKRIAALQALIDQQKDAGEPTSPAEQQPEVETEAETTVESEKEVTMPKKAKKAKAAKAKVAKTKKVAAKASANGAPREGSKAAILYNLMTRKSGFTQAEANKATGWKSVNISLQAKIRGLKLRREKTDNGSRYYID